jgi:hypothetical protein
VCSGRKWNLSAFCGWPGDPIGQHFPSREGISGRAGEDRDAENAGDENPIVKINRPDEISFVGQTCSPRIVNDISLEFASKICHYFAVFSQSVVGVGYVWYTCELFRSFVGELSISISGFGRACARHVSCL